MVAAMQAAASRETEATSGFLTVASVPGVARDKVEQIEVLHTVCNVLEELALPGISSIAGEVCHHICGQK